MKRIITILLALSLMGCAKDIYSVPSGSDLPSSPQEIENQQKLCLDEGIGTINEHFGYGSVIGTVIGGAGFGAAGGAFAGAATGGESQSEYLRNYMRDCMKKKGYIFEGTK
jgi:hypothetical protein